MPGCVGTPQQRPSAAFTLHLTGMPDEAGTDRRPGSLSPGAVASALLGVTLFVYFVQRAGIGEIAAGIQRLGWMFLLVVTLGGLRLAARAEAWRGCLEGAHRLTSGLAFRAMVAGDTLGNLTPLSILVGEPAKALFASDREPLSRTLPALAVENLFYTLSAALVIAGGAFALVLRLRPADAWWLAGVGLVVSLIVLITVVHVIIWRHVRVASGLMMRVANRGLAPSGIARWADRVHHVEDRVYTLYPRDPGRLVRLTLWELAFHTLAVLEIYVVLSLISDVSPTVLDAFVFESTNRFITAVFKVVPMRLGIDEASTAAFAELLAFGTVAGVTLAIVRKARMLVWMTAGVLLLVSRGVSVRRAIAVAETTSDAAGQDGAAGPTAGGAAVVVMARSPEGARAPKSRLASVVPNEQDRRRLYAAFLTDVVSACRMVAGISLRVAYTADGGTTGFDQTGVTPDELMPQRGADLGERERGVFEDLFRTGFSPVIMIGSDLPTLPTQRISEALDRLGTGRDRVVLGPAADGGYYLIGLATPSAGRPIPDLFTGIRWSSEATRADTIAAAVRYELQVDLLDECHDVDDEADLTRLRAALSAPEGAHRAPATRSVLNELLGA